MSKNEHEIDTAALYSAHQAWLKAHTAVPVREFPEKAMIDTGAQMEARHQASLGSFEYHLIKG